jgi:hypothetical protein
LEIQLVVESSGEALNRICSILATISDSPIQIILDKLTIVIPIGIEIDDIEDLNYTPRIPLEPTSYSDLDWRRLQDVLLRKSHSRSGISEFPIARQISFDFQYPNTPWHYPEFSVDNIEAHRWNCEAFVSDLVEREFPKLNQKRDGFKFEHRALEENWP